MIARHTTLSPATHDHSDACESKRYATIPTLELNTILNTQKVHENPERINFNWCETYENPERVNLTSLIGKWELQRKQVSKSTKLNFLNEKEIWTKDSKWIYREHIASISA